MWPWRCAPPKLALGSRPGHDDAGRDREQQRRDLRDQAVADRQQRVDLERLAGGPHWSWNQFAAENPDLLVRSPSPLAVFYTSETLISERARHTFVMPDRIAAATTAWALAPATIAAVDMPGE